LAGLSFGAGIYTYNAYPVFALPVAVLLLWVAGRELAPRIRDRLVSDRGQRRTLVSVALFIGGSILAAWPMIRYASDPEHGYLNHHRSVSVFQSDEWKSRDWLDRVRFSLDRVKDFYAAAFWKGQPDGADAAGARSMVDRISLLLVTVGVLLLLPRWREPASATVLASLVLLPISSEFTFNALFRRSLGLVPFISILAALPLANLWRRAGTYSAPLNFALRVAPLAVLAAIGYQSLSYYFRDFPDSDIARFTFAVEIAEASKYMQDLPEDTYVYFYSARWSFNYETRRYLAPNLEGEDRSKEFGTFGLQRERSSAVAFVLLPPYTEYASQLVRLYPGGTLTQVEQDGVLLFRAYYLPPESDSARTMR
ncbi:MAG TPA: hypothetical protein VNN12_06720, partial [Dehalococcoidia bacterium]|nr:hypothetical protein [Dehalococcoidia bacterium]